MTPTVTLGAHPQKETKACCAHDEQAASFSRARHFGLCLVPFLVALSFTFAKDYVSRGYFAVTYVEPLKSMLAQDASGWFHWLVLGLFVFGVGSAVTIIHFLNRLEAWEASQEN